MSEAAALTEQIAGLLAEHATWDFSGTTADAVCTCGEVVLTDGRITHRTHLAEVLAARLADSRPVVSEAAIRACAIHLFTVDRDRKGRGLVDWMYASDYEKDFFTAEARAALTAALPHMGDGKADAWDECCREHERECDDLTYDDSGNVIDTGCDRNPYRLSPTGDDTP